MLRRMFPSWIMCSPGEHQCSPGEHLQCQQNKSQYQAVIPHFSSFSSIYSILEEGNMIWTLCKSYCDHLFFWMWLLFCLQFVYLDRVRLVDKKASWNGYISSSVFNEHKLQLILHNITWAEASINFTLHPIYLTVTNVSIQIDIHAKTGLYKTCYIINQRAS